MFHYLTNIFASESGPLPNFLGIGAQRAGTSWLHEMLRHHPEIFLPAIKELHFFDEKPDFNNYEGVGGPGQRHFYDMDSPTHWRWYRRQFKKGKKFNVVGEITPFYAILSEQRVAFIAEKLPGLRIIYIIRNPVQRAWSAFRRVWFLETGHSNDDFNTDVALKTIMFPAKLRHGDYSRNTGVYEKIFGRDRILYLSYDDIVEKPQDVVYQVCAFLGVTKIQLSVSIIQDKINSAPGLAIPESVEKVLRAHFADQISFLKTKFGRTFEY